MEFVPQTFKRYFENFLVSRPASCRNTTDNVYLPIPQSRFITYPAKLCDQSRSIKTGYDTDRICKYFATTRRQQTLISLSIQIKVEE